MSHALRSRGAIAKWRFLQQLTGVVTGCYTSSRWRVIRVATGAESLQTGLCACRGYRKKYIELLENDMSAANRRVVENN